MLPEESTHVQALTTLCRPCVGAQTRRGMLATSTYSPYILDRLNYISAGWTSYVLGVQHNLRLSCSFVQSQLKAHRSNSYRLERTREQFHHHQKLSDVRLVDGHHSAPELRPGIGGFTNLFLKPGMHQTHLFSWEQKKKKKCCHPCHSETFIEPSRPYARLTRSMRLHLIPPDVDLRCTDKNVSGL